MRLVIDEIQTVKNKKLTEKEKLEYREKLTLKLDFNQSLEIFRYVMKLEAGSCWE